MDHNLWTNTYGPLLMIFSASFNEVVDRLVLGINDLESQQKKISKRIKKQKKEVKQEYESVNEIDLDKVVRNVQSYCDLGTKNSNVESIKKFDSVFQNCTSPSSPSFTAPNSQPV